MSIFVVLLPIFIYAAAVAFLLGYVLVLGWFGHGTASSSDPAAVGGVTRDAQVGRT